MSQMTKRSKTSLKPDIMDEPSLHGVALKIAGLKAVPSHNLRTSGKIEFVKDSGPVRRDVRTDGFKWTSGNLKNLAKILWSAQRAHSYAIASYRLFSKMPSSGFSPDGLLGGRGYIQSVKDMRQSLAASVETLSSFTDTIQDEINAEHWKQSSDEQVSEIVSDVEKVKSNPEEFVDNEFSDDQQPFDSGPFDSYEDSDEDEPITNPSPDDFDEGFVPDEDEIEEEDDEDDEDGY
jgi:hypothetical protein